MASRSEPAPASARLLTVNVCEGTGTTVRVASGLETPPIEAVTTLDRVTNCSLPKKVEARPVGLIVATAGVAAAQATEDNVVMSRVAPSA